MEDLKTHTRFLFHRDLLLNSFEMINILWKTQNTKEAFLFFFFFFGMEKIFSKFLLVSIFPSILDRTAIVPVRLDEIKSVI